MLALSWGLGLQSTTLLEMSICGDLPKLDAAIFADTGFEHDYSHQILDYYAPRAEKAGIPVYRIAKHDIFNDTYTKVSLPLFIMGTDRQITRKCTRDYKIRPIQRKIRDLLGVNRRGRLRADLVTLWLGITIDEIHRAKDSRVAYITHKFPLLDLGYYRWDCSRYLEDKGLPIPKKSSCVFCPYKKKGEWREISQENKALIADLQTHINQEKLVKIGGQAKEVSFVPWVDFLLADFLAKEIREQPDAMCDGGFCNS